MKVVKEVEVNRGLGLDKGVVALVELVVEGFVVSIWGDGKHLSPQAIILAVRETENVVGP